MGHAEAVRLLLEHDADPDLQKTDARKIYIYIYIYIYIDHTLATENLLSKPLIGHPISVLSGRLPAALCFC